MSRFNIYKKGTSALLTLGMMVGAAAPIVAPGAASAEPLFRGSTGSPSTSTTTTTGVTIPYGARLPVYYAQADKIVVAPNETVPLTLTLTRNVRSSNGALLMAQGTQVVGQLQPTAGGSQFVARELIIGGRSLPIDATSQIITQTQEVTGGSNIGSILQGAAVGAAAAAGIGVLTGNRKIEILEVLGGAGAGALGGLLLGNRKKMDVVVINPNTDLELTLRSNLALR
jgi:hypothetical protein